MRTQIKLSAAFLLLSLATSVLAADAGESKEALGLKNRSKAPVAADIDGAATVDALIAKPGAGDWSQSKGARVEAYIVQVEREQDADIHVVLATAANEPDTHKWLIAEITPAWMKRNAHMSAAKLRGLVGKKVEVTGWLYFEPDADQNDPRGTRWEIHPVTDLAVSQ